MQVKKVAVTMLTRRAMRYVEHRPVENFGKLMRVGKVLTRGRDEFYGRAIGTLEGLWNDREGPWHDFFVRFLTQMNPRQRDKFLENFMINDSILGFTAQHKNEEKYRCNIPWAILMDPTSACNLKCTGCWAAEYDRQDGLTFEEMDRVVRQGRELSCYFYIFSGGEPLLRKKDIFRLCEAHPDCVFAAFTNGTLIDEAFAQEMKRVGNFFPALSIEGFEEETDLRRGKGTFRKVTEAMDILRENHLAFGFSCCYHSKNVETVGSDAFIDFMVEKGAWFGWYFTFIPVGSDAPTELMVTPAQREYMFHRVRELRLKKPIFLLDFWNDGQYSGGCIAGGRRYFHINAAGDAEPCAFIHYSNMNIRDHSVLEILHSPLFQQYRAGQPFNGNMLRPCPLLDNPERLREMVRKSGAKSTQPMDPEDVGELTGKCEYAAKAWGTCADRLWGDEVCRGCAQAGEEEKTASR